MYIKLSKYQELILENQSITHDLFLKQHKSNLACCDYFTYRDLSAQDIVFVHKLDKNEETFYKYVEKQNVAFKNLTVKVLTNEEINKQIFDNKSAKKVREYNIEQFFKNDKKSASLFTHYMSENGTIISKSVGKEILTKDLYNEYVVLNTFDDDLRKWVNVISRRVFQKNNFLLKEILFNPVSLDKISHLSLYPYKNYIISEKTDGVHGLLYISNKSIHYLFDQYQTEKTSLSSETLLEGEYIKEKGALYFIPFDIIIVENDWKICEEIYENRIKRLKNFIPKLKLELVSIREKKFHTDFIAIQKTDLYVRAKDKKIEGLIFTENKPYFETTIYKWKITQTIDFLAKKKEEGKYLLFVGISKPFYNYFNFQYKNEMKTYGFTDDKNYGPIVFYPSLYVKNCEFLFSQKTDLDDKIVELYWDNDKWNLLHLRPDRQVNYELGQYFGNDYKIAEETWGAIINPLNIDNIFEKSYDNYFLTEKVDEQVKVIYYHSIIKNMLFEKFIKNAKNVIDFGGGRGQDLIRYCKYNIQKLTAIDNDANALQEFMLKKYKFFKKFKTDQQLTFPLLNLVNINITATPEEILKYKDFDICVFNFSIHYFIFDFKTFLTFLSKNMNKSSIVVITTLVGEKINELLEKNESFSLSDDKIIEKYRIVKMDKNQGKVKQISVKLPFSAGKMYDEYVVYFHHLEEMLKKIGYNKIVMSSFNIAELEEKKIATEQMKKIYNELDDIDKKWTSLNGLIVFERKAE